MPRVRASIQAAATSAGVTSRAQLARETAKANLIRSVFRVYPQGETDAHALSGFIFKATYRGKEEIFGVIAQHAMPAYNSHGRIGMVFTARVMQNDQVVDIPAAIVGMTSLSMPDLALVKFLPEDEKLLTPLVLAEEDPTQNDLLQFVGFGDEQLSFLTDTPLQEKSLFSLRFPMEGDPYSWPGICGSPVLNEAGEVVGTVTGFVRKKPDPDHYTGFATRNLYLRALVYAYHGDIEKASFPFILGEQKIVDLRPDEFISLITFKDENGKTIFRKAIHDKFPYSTVIENLPNARYVELYIEKVWWSGHALVEGGNILDARYVAYDLQKKQIIEDKKRRICNNNVYMPDAIYRVK